MKAAAKKSATPAKKTGKPVLKAKAGATKAAPKPVAKAIKAVGKSVIKKAGKPLAVKKSPAKPARVTPAKTAVKSAAKTATVKGKARPNQSAAKPLIKPVAKAGAGKSVVASKSTAKNINASSKAVARTPVKDARPAKPVKVSVAVKAKPVKQVKAAQVAGAGKKPAAPVPSPTTRPPEKTMLIPAPPALKPGRRSSARALSHMPPPAPMVPTHAPDAAKASYSTIAERVIAPPPHVAAKKDPKLANNWKTKAADVLSDEEVKAMPDVEYMNDKQMAFFRHKLSILKQDIHNSAGETTEHLREDTVVVPDPADRATIEEEHALELRTRDRERKLLKKIEQSIARIDSGDYGYCDETGEPIGVGRLIARPTANLSLEAQQRRELKQKMFGD